ncbi:MULTISPECIES: hypothetical protein [unclassified Streptomyces]|uniref:hypothetical protein n=1 Tax=unclassified Streptomyces TaxID=2593676 RepID=UPI00081DE259|nr:MULTISPECIES: hypothetical protein [unclassified Streptomyces]MYX22123.1 hypothetical protein [Streptomyces sp. SID8380]SCD70501.1 hypothetical protein GA0115251_11955 [Streptomyces sp. TverLS-915]
MFRKIFVVAAAATLFGLATVPAQAASGPPSGAPCSVGSTSTICFAAYGDHIWVKDTKADGHAAVGLWVYSSDLATGHYCANATGAKGGWKDCNYNMRENVQIRFRSYSRAHADDNEHWVSGTASPLFYANTGG